MIDDLNKNVNTEIEILAEIAAHLKRYEVADPQEKRLINGTIDSLRNTLKIINNSIPEILNNISIASPLVEKKEIKEIKTLEKVSVSRTNSEMLVTLQKKQKEDFLRELSISESFIKKLKKEEKVQKEKYQEFKAARGYLKLSNKLFLDYATKITKAGYFSGLSREIKKANLDILFESYVAMMIFTTIISFVVGLFLMIFFLFFNFNPLSASIISATNISSMSLLLKRLAYVIWVPLVVPVLTFASLYYYPSTEKSSIARKIDQELPFAVVHMSAISSSGIEPTEIFKIIGLSNEYPYLKREIRKILNQINLYGYDFITALNNVSKSTPSTKLSELLAGLATNLSTGGDLSQYFNKRSETLLFDYKLEREKFTKTAESFMDIYISVVIAAPMVLMLLLIMMYVSGLATGLSPGLITLAIILVISLINILFLGILQLKQPTY